MSQERMTGKAERILKRAARVAETLLHGLAAAALVLPSATPAFAQSALPAGGKVVSGAASISQPSATALTVNQTSPSAIVNWNSFSVGQGNTVTFNQPGASAAILNRVTGNTPSSIAGQITGNGQVYLVNPNGIAITPSGAVKIGGGFVASTLGISDADFNAGKRAFSGGGASAAVSNAGSIAIGSGGYAALIGGSVSNSGTISVPLGKVGLGSGERATLDLSGDGFMQVALPTAAASGNALVDNSGRIRAKGGSIELKAATVREAVRDAVNVSGKLSARSVSGRNGSIVLDGGSGGSVKVAGKLNASGKSGGRIDVTGRDVSLAGATISAKGETAGGLVRIGGTFQGGKTDSPDFALYVSRFNAPPALAAADFTTIDAATKIDVSASAPSGVGGTVVVWSELKTRMNGSLDARGGLRGGAVEISSKKSLADVALGKLSIGTGGKLLLDPETIIVVGGQSGYSTAGDYTADDGLGMVVLKPQDISDLLVVQGIDVTLQASNSIVLQGNIGFLASGSFNNHFGTLTLQAGGNVDVIGTILLRHASQDFTTDGSVVISANQSGFAGPRNTGSARINATSATFDLGRGNLSMTMNADDGDYLAGTINPGAVWSANAVTISHLSPAGDGDRPWIIFTHDITSSGPQTYTGNLAVQPWTKPDVTLSTGQSITWTDEATSKIFGFGVQRSWLRIVENGVLTGFGQFYGVDTVDPNSGWVPNESNYTPPPKIPAYDATRIAVDVDKSGTYTRTYGDADSTLASQLPMTFKVTRGSLYASDTIASLMGATTLSINGPGVTANAGPATVTLASNADPATFALSTTQFYYFVRLTDTVPVTIAPRPVYGDAVSAQYTYGSPVAVAKLSNLVNGDALQPVVTFAADSTQRTLQAAGADFALDARESVKQAAAFTISGIAGSGASNYVFVPGTAPTGTVTIDPKTLGYASTPYLHVKTYGDTFVPGSLADLALSGVMPGDDVAITAAQLKTAAGITVAIGDRTPAGSYGVHAAGLTGAQAANYALGAAPAFSFDVLRRTITATVTAQDSTYGNGNTSLVQLNGVLSGDSVSPVVLANGFPLTSTTPVGTYTISAGILPTGPQGDNYAVDQINSSWAQATIAQRPVTATLTSASTVYGTTLTPSVAFSGLVPGDAVNPVTDIAGLGAAENNVLPAGRPVGTYAASVVGLGGAAGGNYTLAVSVPGTLTVTPKALTYTAYGDIRTYGDKSTVKPLAGQLTGFYGTDGSSITAAYALIDGTGNVAPLADTTKAGSYASTVTGIASSVPGLAANYTIDHAASTQGTVTVRPAALTYTIAAATGVYGSAAAAGAMSDTAMSGFVNGEFAVVVPGVTDLAGKAVPATVMPINQGGAAIVPAGTQAGVYRITATGFDAAGTGFDPANYTITGSPALLTIAQKPITYAIADTTSVYGTLATPAVTLNGLFGSDNVSTALTVTKPGFGAIALATRSAAGAYALTASGLSGTAAANYTLDTANSTSGTLTVQPKPITALVADSTRVYGELPLSPQATLNGILPGDAVAATAIETSRAGTVVTLDRFNDAGAYQQRVTAIGGFDAANYSFNPLVAVLPGTHTVTPRPVTVTFGNVGAYFSQTPGQASQTIDAGSLGALPFKDNITFASYTPTGLDAGTYPLSGYAASGTIGNYSFTFKPGTLTISPLPLVGTAGAMPSFIYGDTTPLQQGTPFNFASALDATPVFGVGYQLSTMDKSGTAVTLAARTPVGSYSVVAALTSKNYDLLSQTPGTVVVTPRTLYAQSAPAAVYGSKPGDLTVSNAVAGDNISVSPTTIVSAYGDTYQVGAIWNAAGGLVDPAKRDAIPAAGNAFYGVTAAQLSGADASNYVLGGAGFAGSGIPIEITKKDITVAGLAPSSVVYGGTLPVNPSSASFNGLVYAADAADLMPQMSATLSRTVAGQTSNYDASTSVVAGGVGTYDWKIAPSITLLQKQPAGGFAAGCLAIGFGCTSANYNLVAGTNDAAPLTVTPKPITFSVSNAATIYGTSTKQAATLTGVLVQDEANLGVALGISTTGGTLQAVAGATYDGSGAAYTTTIAKAPAGNYTTSVNALTGAAAGNYVPVLAGSTKGTLTVDKKEISYKAFDASLFYDIGGVNGSMANFGNYALYGIVAGDQVTANLAIQYPLTGKLVGLQGFTPTTLQPGTYNIIATGIAGASAGNYKLGTWASEFAYQQTIPAPAVPYNQKGTLDVVDPGILAGFNLIGTGAQDATKSAVDSFVASLKENLKPPTVELPNTTQPVDNTGGTTVETYAGTSSNSSSGTSGTGASASAGAGAEAGVDYSSGDVSAGAHASAGAGADANAGPNGANASAGANAHADVGACIGNVCNTTSADLEAEAHAKINAWSTTPIDLGSSVTATVSNETTIQLNCGGVECSVTNTLTVSAGASVEAKLDLLSGMTLEAKAGFSVSDTVTFTSGCGQATCIVSGGVTYEVTASVSSEIDLDHGPSLHTEVGVEAGVTVSGSAGVEGSHGSVEASGGVTFGSVSAGEHAEVSFGSDGVMNVDLGLTLALGVGLSFDIKFSVDWNEVGSDIANGVMGYDTTYYVYADPAAADARSKLLAGFATEAADLKQREIAMINDLLQGKTLNPAEFKRRVEAMQMEEARLYRGMGYAQAGIDARDGNITINDYDPPKMIAVTEHHDGAVDKAADFFGL